MTETSTETLTPTVTALLSETPTPTVTVTPADTAVPTATSTPTAPNGDAHYFYDGDNNLVLSIVDDVTTYYPNSSYEKRVEGGTEKTYKYYFAGSAHIAMRENGVLTWLLSDHLGSTTITADASGNLLSSVKYTAFRDLCDPRAFFCERGGEIRAGESLTDYQYTGQRNEVEIGLYYYVARFYDPALGRFIQADTIIPNPGNAQDWDRYAYVRNNPIRYNDPSGHTVCDEEGNCYNANGWYANRGYHFSVSSTWKKMINSKFGITMSDKGDKKWDNGNLQLVFSSISVINKTLNGNVRSMVKGAIFKLNDQDSGGEYHGLTHISRNGPTGIDFFTKGTQPIRQMNIFHEFGHLLDNTPGTWDVFTNAVANQTNPSWVVSDKKIDSEALKSKRILNDPNYPSVDARQTYSGFGPSEQWADAFANYVAGNFDLESPKGRDIWNFVRISLAQYIGPE